MIVPASVRRRYEAIMPYLGAVRDTVRDTVLGFCEANGFAYDAGRLKTLESLAEKIESGRFSCWSELDDLFGCAIVVPTLAAEPEVLKFLRTAFIEARVRSRGETQKPPDTFRFEAARFYGRLAPLGTGGDDDPRYRIIFEVQVRTAFEHAWSVTTHAIYKSRKVDWKAKRLAAQLKAAVEQLDSLVLAYEESSRTIVGHPWPELDTQQAVADRLTRLVDEGVIPEELAPQDWSRFAENFYWLLRRSKTSSRSFEEQMKFVMTGLGLFEQQLRDLGRDGIPMSLSLLQLALGSLSRCGHLVPPLYSFYPLVTDELKSLYPEAANFEDGSFSIAD